jgi:hypothetical protein
LYLILREYHRLRVSENRFLRKIFGTKSDEIIRGCGKLRSRELHNLYCLPKKIVIIQSKRRKWIEHVAGMVEKRNAYRVLVAKTEGKRLPGKYRSSWESNINVGFREYN